MTDALILGCVLAAVVIATAVYLHTAAGKVKLAAVEAKLEGFISGFHLGTAQASTPIVEAPVASVAPNVAPPATPNPGTPPPNPGTTTTVTPSDHVTVTLTGPAPTITQLLNPPRQTAPTVAPPVVTVDPNVLHYFHPIEVSAASPVYKKTDPLTGPTEVLCAYMASDGTPTSELQVWFCGDFPIPMPPDTPKGNISADWSIPIPSAGYVGFLANGSARFSAQLQRTA